MLKEAVKRAMPKALREQLHAAITLRKRIPDYREYQDVARGKVGIEIGGPSPAFRTVLPIYQVAGQVDGVNFSNQTVWEGSLSPGRTFNYFGARKGQQFIGEATELRDLPSEKFDFLLSCNCLEHVANPLKALFEWNRVLRPGGAIILVLPRKDGNFDHLRPITTFDHLLQDYESNIAEDDLTHLDEILRLHDLSRDPQAGSIDQFKARSLKNFENRTLHHHVFDQGLATEILAFCGFAVQTSHSSHKDHFALAIKA